MIVAVGAGVNALTLNETLAGIAVQRHITVNVRWLLTCSTTGKKHKGQKQREKQLRQ